MLHVVAVPAEDFDCFTIKRGEDVVICVSDGLLSPRGAVALTLSLQATFEPVLDLLSQLVP